MVRGRTLDCCFIINLILFVFFSNILAELYPDTLWTRTYGGGKSEFARAFCATEDGGYLLVGRTESFIAKGGDIYIVKTDSVGEMLWSRVYGTPNFDDPATVQQTTDGGYVVLGRAGYFVIKMDSEGDTLWSKRLLGIDNFPVGIIETPESDYIIAGSVQTYSANHRDIYITRIGNNGEVVWHRVYGVLAEQQVKVLRRTNDDNYIMAGTTFISEEKSLKCFLMKFDGEGDTLWARTFAGERINCIDALVMTKDGGFFILGSVGKMNRTPMSKYWRIWMLKADSLGNVEWERRCREYCEDHEQFRYKSAIQTKDGEYVLVGSYNAAGRFGYDWQSMIVKLNDIGKISWMSSFGDGDYRCAGVLENDDGEYVILVSRKGDMGLLKTGRDIEKLPSWKEVGVDAISVYSDIIDSANFSVTVSCEVPKHTRIVIWLCNSERAKLKRIVDRNTRPSKFNFDWDASTIPSGKYCLCMEAGGYNLKIKDINKLHWESFSLFRKVVFNISLGWQKIAMQKKVFYSEGFEVINPSLQFHYR